CRGETRACQPPLPDSLIDLGIGLGNRRFEFCPRLLPAGLRLGNRTSIAIEQRQGQQEIELHALHPVIPGVARTHGDIRILLPDLQAQRRLRDTVADHGTANVTALQKSLLTPWPQAVLGNLRWSVQIRPAEADLLKRLHRNAYRSSHGAM